MSFADIESTWRSPENRPAPAQLEAHKAHFIGELRRRRRRGLLFLVGVFTVLGAITLYFAARLLFAWPAPVRFNWSEEWAIFPLLSLPWIAAMIFARRHWRARRDMADAHASILDGIRALLAENHQARARIKAGTILHVVMLAILPVVIFQLRATGKAGDEILIPAYVLWPLFSLVKITLTTLHDRRTLVPRERELQALLASYE